MLRWDTVYLNFTLLNNQRRFILPHVNVPFDFTSYIYFFNDSYEHCCQSVRIARKVGNDLFGEYLGITITNFSLHLTNILIFSVMFEEYNSIYAVLKNLH